MVPSARSEVLPGGQVRVKVQPRRKLVVLRRLVVEPAWRVVTPTGTPEGKRSPATFAQSSAHGETDFMDENSCLSATVGAAGCGGLHRWPSIVAGTPHHCFGITFQSSHRGAGSATVVC